MDSIAGDIFTFRPSHQSLKAWSPFWDCVDILFQFQNSDIADGDEELREWRISWVAGVTLLRTIGHVLAKVDSTCSKDAQLHISQFWQRIQSDKNKYNIFWEFIERERNNILKAYEFGAKFQVDQDGPKILLADGADAFQKYRLAVYWWRTELMLLEANLKG